MGFAQLSVFGGYSIYFPELFPTRLRGTGVGFCYNTVRYLAAGFPPMLMTLNQVLVDQGVDEPFRKAATYMSFIFALGPRRADLGARDQGPAAAGGLSRASV